MCRRTASGMAALKSSPNPAMSGVAEGKGARPEAGMKWRLEQVSRCYVLDLLY